MNKLDQSWKDLRNDYKLTKVLGQGVEGVVLKAIHRASNRKVAIKRV
jgi:serine/threonine protein kinase